MKKLYLVPLILVGVFLLLVIIGTLTKDKNSMEGERDISREESPESINKNPSEVSSRRDGGGKVLNLRGFSLSPISYSSEDFTKFLEIASENGKVVTWAGDWHELQKENSPAKTLIELSKKYNFIPMIITSLPNSDEKDEYINTVKKFATENEILYLGLGNEINSDYQQDYDETFSETYDEIKKVSPNTQVFTIFQLEYMKRDLQWNLISKFEKADLIAFTTYPIILYQTPSEIPENYYSEITQKTSKQIAFTEVGWPRKENQQIEFIKIFNAQTASMNPKFSIWPFLYNQNIQTPFNTMGLLQNGQETSVELEEWKKL